MRTTLLAIAACVSCTTATSETRTAAPAAAPAPSTGHVLTFPVDVKPQPRHAYIATTHALAGTAVTITTSGGFAGPDRFGRQLPACIELAPGVDAINIDFAATAGAAWLEIEGEDPGYDASKCDDGP